MKFQSSVSCRSAWVAGMGRAACTLGVVTSMAGAAPSKYDHDIAIYDRLMANIPPGRTYAVCGDYGLTMVQMKTYRDKLVAERSGIHPNFATPPDQAFKWTDGIVNYRFDATQAGDGTLTAAKMQQFRDAVNEWAAFANLHFVEFTGTQPANYITVSEDPGRSGGFSSSIGMGGGEQTLLIGPTSWNRGTVCHEVGHALGLFHEQQRDDRDTYINLFPANYLPGADGNFTLIPGGTAEHGPYDFYSVMHYERNALSIDPATKDTIEPKPPYIQYINIIGRVGDRTLSKLDRAGIAEIYGNPTSLPGPTVTNTNDSGPGSLRTAIYYAFDKSTDTPAVPTTISFNIPTSDPNYSVSTGVFTIQPTYEITAPGAGTTIDGETQTVFTGNSNPSGPEIVLDGSKIVAGNLGLSAAGVVLRETNCVVRNLVIHGFNADGIVFDGGTATTNGTIPSGNLVTACYIGTDQTGTVGIGNGTGYPGIEFFGGAQNNTIGGTGSAARNVISGNSGNGIQLSGSGTTGNTISGNYIGTDASGSGLLPNGYSGVSIYAGAGNNIVGGSVAGARNVISGNQNHGVIIFDSGTTGNVIQGNYIGTNAAGATALGNGQESHWAGIGIFGGAQANIIGGATAAAANVISGNTGQGVAIADTNTNLNSVRGNFIGTDPTGITAIPNEWSGVQIYGGAQSNIIGGTGAYARNIISGNANAGVVISGAGTDMNEVQGNFVGTDSSGLVALPNVGAGISIYGGAQSNVIGGVVAGARNILSGNLNQGITLSESGTASNVIQGNYVGLDVSGLASLPNYSNGIDIFGGSHANTIGGTSPGAGNYVAGNVGAGIGISGIGTNSNLVKGNTIGLNIVSGIVPNADRGIAMFQSDSSDPSGPQFNIVGGSASGASNRIAGNTYEGIALFDPGTSKNTISGNSIYSNLGGGIGLGTFYSDSNNNQAAPELDSAILGSAANPGGTDLNGILYSTANTAFRIEFFANAAGADEGESFIGWTNATTNGSGTAPFGPVHLAAVALSGSAITCTATDPNGNTSQFSFPVDVTATDTDGDSIPDNWTSAHFGHPTGQLADRSRATDDADGDGTTNLQEFLAGTDPKLGSSSLRTLAASQNGADFTFTFTSNVGKTYRVEASEDLAPSSWQVLTDQLFGTGATITISDPIDASRPRRFYRAALVP